jgi:hypothetical protein
MNKLSEDDGKKQEKAILYSFQSVPYRIFLSDKFMVLREVV